MTDAMRNTLAWQRHRAARSLAHHARDAHDLADLLDMLGLSAAEGRVPPGERPSPEPGPARHLVKLDEDSAGRLGNLLCTALPSNRPSNRRHTD